MKYIQLAGKLTVFILMISVLLSCKINNNQELSRYPNFIILFTDDQRYDALGFTGNTKISTPNLDSICREGVYFSQACVTTSICSPSRAAVLTGRYGSANGVVSVGQVGMHPGERTLFHLLKEKNYTTGLVGKWHLMNDPDSCGFDYSACFNGNGPYYNREFLDNGKPYTARGFIEDVNVQLSIEFIKNAKRDKKPFALFHCTQLPHMDHNFDWDILDETQEFYRGKDLGPPPSWKDDLEGKPGYLKTSRSRQRAVYYGYNDRDSLVNHLERYYGSITEMDASVGGLFSFLKSSGLDENTYIIFMSDNGWFLGDHTFTSKVLAYEESIRVPFAIAGPGVKPHKSDALVLNVDIAPTLLELAGLPVPESMHGVSLVPALKGKWQVVREAVLYEAPESNLGSYPMYAVRTREWKYIQTFDIHDPGQLIYEELYDLDKDPFELNNLAGNEEFTSLTKELSEKLDSLKNLIR